MTRLTFSFDGYAETSTDLEVNQSRESDSPAQIMDEYAKAISDDITTKINERFRSRGIRAGAVSINFDEGSITWLGVVEVLGVSASIAGNVALMIYIKNTIAYVVNRVMRSWSRRLLGRSVQIRTIRTNVDPSPTLTESGASSPTAREYFRLPALQALIVITGVNVAAVIGGTVGQWITVQTSFDRMREAEAVYEQAQAKADLRAEQFTATLSSLEDDARDAQRQIDERLVEATGAIRRQQAQSQSLLDQISTVVQSAETRADTEIAGVRKRMARFTTNIQSVEADLVEATAQLQAINLSMESTRDSITSIEAELDSKVGEVNELLSELDQRVHGQKTGLADLWHQATYGVRGVSIALLSLVLVAIVLSVVTLRMRSDG